MKVRGAVGALFRVLLKTIQFVKAMAYGIINRIY